MLLGDPIEVKHECEFVVIVASNDVRGQEERRQGEIYKLIDQADMLLGGLQFEVEVENGAIEMLNCEPFVPAGVAPVVLDPELTAYAAHFRTAFSYWTPDRRTKTVGTADEILLGITPNNQPTAQTNLPGVIGRER